MTLPTRSFSLCLALCLATPALSQIPDLEATVLPETPLPQSSSSIAQEQQPASTPPSNVTSSTQTAAPAAQTTAPSADDQLKAEEKQRMLGIMPAFNAVQGGVAPPLRPKQKFELWFKSAIDPFTIVTAGLDGAIEQGEDTYPEYGQGAEGYGKRFGAAYADNVDGNLWGNAILPVLLHQDPRYFRLGHGSFKRRLWYAALSTVRCKGDNGKWEPNYSNVAGNLIGGGISNLYYPASDRGIGLTFERGFTVTAEGAFGALAFEFYPDAIGYLKRHHHKADAAASSPASPAPSAPQP